MSVLIKGMKMPENSRKCPFAVMAKDWEKECIVGGRYEWNPDSVCEGCPLAEVPTPHGDLIDRWELTETAMIDPDEGKYVAVYRADEVDEAPVVIEAEGRE